MIDLGTVDKLEVAIEDLVREWRHTPGLLLTEDDLKCHLMARFAGIGDLGVPVESADVGVRATAVHAEVPWFDDQDQLRLRPDITITDPSALSTQRAMQKGLPLLRKGFHFTGPSVVVELKLYRGRDGIRPTALGVIRRDVEKIERLVERARRLSPGTFLYGIVVVFGKYSGTCSEVNQFAAQTRDNVKVMVRSAELNRRTGLGV
jgi:hypothetical protein